eukprot:c35012_g1_i1 orf=120-446(+)
MRRIFCASPALRSQAHHAKFNVSPCDFINNPQVQAHHVHIQYALVTDHIQVKAALTEHKLTMPNFQAVHFAFENRKPQVKAHPLADDPQVRAHSACSIFEKQESPLYV